jgi:hypothetical protein
LYGEHDAANDCEELLQRNSIFLELPLDFGDYSIGFVGWEFDRSVFSVEQATENDFVSVELCVSLFEFFSGMGYLPPSGPVICGGGNIEWMP